MEAGTGMRTRFPEAKDDGAAKSLSLTIFTAASHAVGLENTLFNDLVFRQMNGAAERVAGYNRPEFGLQVPGR